MLIAADPARSKRWLDVLEFLGRRLDHGARILDLGCGEGHGVRNLRDLGYEAFGADVLPTWEGGHDEWFDLIESAPYRFPYEDASFDFVYSEGVFEHVKNYTHALSEIRRVLKPGGTSLHLFPARWRVVEGHVYVPFAGGFKPYWWLRLWAGLGIRNEFQDGQTPVAVATANYAYLRDGCTYYSAREIRRIARAHFEHPRFIEAAVGRCQPELGRRRVGAVMSALPPIEWAVRGLHMRALLLT